MRTEPRELHGATFDLLVVGAGIQGAAVAREAAVRGRSVLLVDARDVAAGTSSRSSRLVHGGLRYLQQGNFALVREALQERERLLRLCPHLVRPLPMLMPFFRGGGPARWQMNLGIRLYSWLARGSTLPRPRTLSAAEAAAAFPGLRTQGLRSATEFYDAATQDSRLTVANVVAAHAHGAAVATHCAVVGIGGDGVRLLDRLRATEVVVRTRHVVNAAGPRADALRHALGIAAEPLVRTTRGSHVVLPPRAGELALAAFLPDGRIQFVIPHHDGTLCGTTDVDDELATDEGGPPAADFEYLLRALGYLLAPPPTRADVRFAYTGWRSLPRAKGPPGRLNREAFVVAETLPHAGAMLHTIVGGKLTTHRSLAERVVAGISGDRSPSPTRRLPLPGGDGPREVTDPLWWRHGSRAARVRELARERTGWERPLCPHRPFLVAELVYALRHEAACTLADVLLRRLVASHGPCLEPACLRAAHERFREATAGTAGADVDADRDRALAALGAEVATLTGSAGAPLAP